jgi:hypothetical protein
MEDKRDVKTPHSPEIHKSCWLRCLALVVKKRSSSSWTNPAWGITAVYIDAGRVGRWCCRQPSRIRNSSRVWSGSMMEALHPWTPHVLLRWGGFQVGGAPGRQIAAWKSEGGQLRRRGSAASAQQDPCPRIRWRVRVGQKAQEPLPAVLCI